MESADNDRSLPEGVLRWYLGEYNKGCAENMSIRISDSHFGKIGSRFWIVSGQAKYGGYQTTVSNFPHRYNPHVKSP